MPPSYNLNKVTVPTSLFYAKGDTIISVEVTIESKKINTSGIENLWKKIVYESWAVIKSNSNISKTTEQIVGISYFLDGYRSLDIENIEDFFHLKCNRFLKKNGIKAQSVGGFLCFLK